MKRDYLIAGLVIIAIIGLYFLFKTPPVKGTLDGFAQCLKEKNVTMYGAKWCPHCQNEKRLFGNSFKFVPYVECPAQPQLCIQKGIEGYPTWILQDGRKLVGEQGLKKLSQESGCELSQP
ncbi:hypothetical protein C4553_03730 [Candidatus Parcubacteria bacterium]|nr:MAG: hypothetical protein C4553_03730 [Candidatus Parcubacteria bacterium]